MPTISRSRVNPSLTPFTALATRARVSPCSARRRRSSRERANTTLPPSTEQVIPGGSGCARDTFPFSITTWAPAAFTVTPAGSAIGAFPILDTSSPLPDGAEDLAPDARLAGRAPAHHALRRGEDRDAQAAHDLRDLVVPGIDPLARPADALQARQESMAFAVVAQCDTDHLEPTLLDRHGVGDVPFLLQDPGEGRLEVRVGDVGARVARPHRVADPGQHVGNRVVHTLLALRTGGSIPSA